jgi:hypothetical protein
MFVAWAWAGLLLQAAAGPGVELVTLGPENWDPCAPDGKEADAIYGDLVLRNDRLICVVANPIAGRNANMVIRNVGGRIIDLTTRDAPADQLGLFDPGAKLYPYRFAGVDAQDASVRQTDDPAKILVRARAITLRVKAEGTPAVETRYTLGAGESWVSVETIFTNTGAAPIDVSLSDLLRAERTFQKEAARDTFTAYDKWFGQAYGVRPVDDSLEAVSDDKQSTIKYSRPGSRRVTETIQPGQSATLRRRIYAGRNLADLAQISRAIAGETPTQAELTVADAAGAPVPGAEVSWDVAGKKIVVGRTDDRGRFMVPTGTIKELALTVSALGHGSKDATLDPTQPKKFEVQLPLAGRVVAHVTDADGRPIPCKVQFRGRDGASDPFFGPDTAEHGVHNVFYSHDGRFEQKLEPGAYEAIVSYGPEYDAAFTTIEISRGRLTPLRVSLRRSVQTPGWISTDFHSHSSPSGDNVSSQLGRVLNLLAEHVEFAPCTEHNRLSTYAPHLEKLGALERMGTCVGIELTGGPGDINHQNAFPLVRKPRVQDDGAPQTDADPVVQIERLALWDDKSKKLVQSNHPDIVKMFFDRNANGVYDGGWRKMGGFMDVIEVHPPEFLLRPPQDAKVRNAIVPWMQLLNQGFRIPGVVNTDAHYTFHGSGWLRNYVRSPTDDPSKIQTLDIVRETERGHLIMTTGPFLEVALSTAATPRAIPGDDATAPDGKGELRVRVQTPNWFDVDRVQVFVNGRPDPALNFTRAANADAFGAGPVKFDRAMPIKLAADAHLIVAAAGERSRLGPVAGPPHENKMPIAVSNPIFVDVDGGGFKACGDTLDLPLPLKGDKEEKP